MGGGGHPPHPRPLQASGLSACVHPALTHVHGLGHPAALAPSPHLLPSPHHASGALGRRHVAAESGSGQTAHEQGIDVRAGNGGWPSRGPLAKEGVVVILVVVGGRDVGLVVVVWWWWRAVVRQSAGDSRQTVEAVAAVAAMKAVVAAAAVEAVAAVAAVEGGATAIAPGLSAFRLKAAGPRAVGALVGRLPEVKAPRC